MKTKLGNKLVVEQASEPVTSTPPFVTRYVKTPYFICTDEEDLSQVEFFSGYTVIKPKFSAWVDGFSYPCLFATAELAYSALNETSMVHPSGKKLIVGSF